LEEIMDYSAVQRGGMRGPMKTPVVTGPSPAFSQRAVVRAPAVPEINQPESGVVIGPGIAAHGGIGLRWGTPRDVTISAGAITVTGSGVYNVDTEGSAASDTLKTINGGAQGDEIVLKFANAAREVVINGVTDNIRCGPYLTLSNVADRMRFVKNASGNWAETGWRST